MDIKEIRSEALGMALKVREILDLIEKGFIEHKEPFLTEALKKEHEINEKEKSLTNDILALAKASKQKKEFSALAQMVEMIERMGDEALGLIERIEIKIAERLLFSEEGVAQFNQTYNTMKRSVDMMIEFLKNRDDSLKQKIIDNGFSVKELVERYRKEHADRLVQGLCTPMGANMYFDMLDFTGNLARHASNIVKLF